MVDASLTLINAVSVHAVGNKLLGDELILSDAALQMTNDKLKSHLLTYFFSSFNSPEYFSFDLEREGAGHNVFYSIVKEIFANPYT